jgi:hypothetical protein
METVTVKWTGFRPLLMNNGSMVDPLNPIVKRCKEITRIGAKKMKDAHYAELYRLKWDGALYFDESIGPFIPNDNIEACIKFGARKLRIGKQAESAVLVADDIVRLEYSGPRTRDALYIDSRFQLKARTKMGTISVRPMFPTGWNMKFTVEFDEEVITRAELLPAMDQAGKLIGLGDWRPKFGRFLSEES